jgi:hypothetical protein
MCGGRVVQLCFFVDVIDGLGVAAGVVAASIADVAVVVPPVVAVVIVVEVVAVVATVVVVLTGFFHDFRFHFALDFGTGDLITGFIPIFNCIGCLVVKIWFSILDDGIPLGGDVGDDGDDSRDDSFDDSFDESEDGDE